MLLQYHGTLVDQSTTMPLAYALVPFCCEQLIWLRDHRQVCSVEIVDAAITAGHLFASIQAKPK